MHAAENEHDRPRRAPLLLAALISVGLLLGACSDDQSGTNDDGGIDPALTGDDPAPGGTQPAPGEELELPSEGETPTQ